MKITKIGLVFSLLFFASFSGIYAQSAPRGGKTPVIIIPGLTGSDLVNSKTGEEVWFKAQRAKDDDLRLPVSPNLARNRDDLVSKDIIRSVKFLKILPETEIYEKLIGALEKSGYREAKWDTAKRGDYRDTFFVFPYDWRRDNVESARLLIRRIETLKRRLGKPNLKFNIVAHSMGGLVARYAAMYGNADIPTGKITPNWAGAKNFNKIFLLGTPNAGSVAAMNALLNGFSYIGGGLNLPFIQNISRYDVFTIPSIYQLLPHEGSLKVFDENLEPMKVDIYDPAVWETYGWGIWKDDDYAKKFLPGEVNNIRPYFDAVLLRAKRFQMALDANSDKKIPVSFYLIGGDCKETQDSFILRQEGDKGRWTTLFKADSYTTAAGQKISSEQLKAVLYSKGDSVVPKRSLALDDLVAQGSSALPVTAEIFQCEGHTKLVTSAEVQDKLLVLLGSAVP